MTCGAINGRPLLHLIQVSGPMSQAELARQTGLSPALVSNILQPFLDQDLLVARGESRQRLLDYLAARPHPDSVLTNDSTLKELGQSAEEGDALAGEILDETAGYLARGLTNVIWSFDPELVVLSGLVVQDCAYLVDATRLALRDL